MCTHTFTYIFFFRKLRFKPTRFCPNRIKFGQKNLQNECSFLNFSVSKSLAVDNGGHCLTNQQSSRWTFCGQSQLPEAGLKWRPEAQERLTPPEAEVHWMKSPQTPLTATI